MSQANTTADTSTEATPIILNTKQLSLLLVSVLIISICGLVYELIIGTLSSYLLGSSVTHFSITIGLFLFAMGIGSYLSRCITRNVLTAFVSVEIAVGVFGGLGAALLFAAFSKSDTFYPAMITLIMLIGGCIGMEIPLLTRMSSVNHSLKDTLSNIFTFDYVGALVGSLLFPLFMLPQLGLLRSAFGIGLLNLGVAAVIVWMFREQLPSWRRLMSITVACAAILVAGFIGANQLNSAFERGLYRDEIIFTQQTPYQRIVMTQHAEDLRLYLDGNLQFSLVDEHRYHEALIHPAATLGRQRDNVLLLGGGDGLALRELLKYDDVKRVVLVDLDPAMPKLATEHLALKKANGNSLLDKRVTVLNTDAMNHLQTTSNLYELILIDLPDPNNESLSKLYSRTFYNLAKRRLARGGIMASQATSPYFARDAFWSIINTVRAEDLHVYPYHVYVPSFGDWGFFVASESELALERYRPQVPVRFMTAGMFTTSLFFDPDTNEVDSEVSTLNHPAVLHYYEQNWKHWH